MRYNGRNVVVIAISTIYSVVSLTTATSVVIIMEIIGQRLPVEGEISYAIVVVSSVIILYFSASRLLHIYRYFSSDTSSAKHIVENKDIKISETSVDLLLNEKERVIIDVLKKANGRILQNTLISKTGMSAPTISRTLISLENKGLIERKRHGMTNEILMNKP
jgi:uncharacterized membrane protein